MLLLVLVIFVFASGIGIIWYIGENNALNLAEEHADAQAHLVRRIEYLNHLIQDILPPRRASFDSVATLPLYTSDVLPEYEMIEFEVESPVECRERNGGESFVCGLEI